MKEGRAQPSAKELCAVNVRIPLRAAAWESMDCLVGYR